jgi:F0F1-type ATP synthase assembly protein I
MRGSGDNIMSTKEFEKTSLDAHVELCAERYGQLDKRLGHLEERTAKIEELVMEIKETISESSHGQSKQLITIGTTVIGVLLTAVIGLITHLILK